MYCLPAALTRRCRLASRAGLPCARVDVGGGGGGLRGRACRRQGKRFTGWCQPGHGPRRSSLPVAQWQGPMRRWYIFLLF